MVMASSITLVFNGFMSSLILSIMVFVACVTCSGLENGPTEKVIYNNTRLNIVVADNMLNSSALESYIEATKDSEWQYDHYPGVVSESGLPSAAYFQGGFSRFVPYQQSGRKKDFKFIVSSVRAFISQHFKVPDGIDDGNGTRVAVVRSSIREKVIAAGDFVPVSSACSNESSFLAIINLNTAWGKNDYGDLVFYDENGDIARSFQPRFGRVYVIKCGSALKINPPSIDTKESLHLLFFEVSVLPKYLRKAPTPEVVFEATDSGDFMDKQYNESLDFIKKLDPKTHIVKDFNTSSGKRIVVFDDVFPESYTDLLYQYHKSFKAYQNTKVNSDSADNVKWVLGSEESNFSSNSVWKAMEKLLLFMAGDDTHTYYDITCNHIRRNDNTEIHLDCEPDEKEYTMLVYLNSNFTVDLYGETVFLTEDHRNIEFGLAPKFGRIVIFEGTIPHSARPVAPTMEGVRFTYAVKTTLKEKKARKKYLEILLDHAVQEKAMAHIKRMQYVAETLKKDVSLVSTEDLAFFQTALYGSQSDSE